MIFATNFKPRGVRVKHRIDWAGAITLTLRHKPHIKRQNPADQVNRDRRTSVEIKPAATGEGVSAEELL